MIFDILIANVLPLYGLILIGFIVGRYARLEVAPMATLMIYALIPVVMFGATATMELTTRYFLPMLIVASISILSSVSAFLLAKRFWENKQLASLLGMLGVSSNATYFGVPIALAIFGKEWLGVYMLMLLPLFMLDTSLAVFFAARGQFNFRDSLISVAKLPILYGALAGLIFNLLGFTLPNLLITYWERFTGALIIVGMMIIGAGLSKIQKFEFNRSFFISLALVRYLLWPALGFLFIAIDVFVLKLLDRTIHSFIVLICACPLAANNVAYAARFKLYPTLTASMVLISTLSALAFIPVLFWLHSAVF